jgi:hypothetical protein
MGLIDEIGSQGDAIAAAAERAKVQHYQIVDFTPDLPEDLDLYFIELERGSTAAAVTELPEHMPPGFYYRYVTPPQ